MNVLINTIYSRSPIWTGSVRQHFKMASIIRLLIYLLFVSTISEAANTRVQVTTPISPVTVGGVEAINCQIWNMQEECNINFFFVYTMGKAKKSLQEIHIYKHPHFGVGFFYLYDHILVDVLCIL